MMRYLFLFFLIPVSSFGQDFRFNQIHASGQYLNPGYMGVTDPTQINYGIQLQWPSLAQYSITQVASYDNYVHDRGSLGGYIMHDSYTRALSSMSEIALTYTHHFPLGKKIKLSVGASPILHYRQFDSESLDYGDIIFPRTGTVYTTDIETDKFIGFDTGLGFMLHGKHFFAGLSCKHLLQYNTLQRPSYILHGGGRYKLNSEQVDLQIQVGGVLSYNSGFYQAGINAAFQIGWFFIGGQLFGSNHYGGVTGVDFEIFKLSYNYHHISSKLTNASSAGIHEVQFSFRPKFRVKDKEDHWLYRPIW